MLITVYVEGDSKLQSLLPWGLRLAAIRADALRLVIATSRGDGKAAKELAPEDELRAKVADCLDRELGEDAWTERVAEEQAGGSEDAVEQNESQDSKPALQVEFFQTNWEAPSASWLKPKGREATQCLVAIQPAYEKEDSEATERRRRLFQEAMCELVMLRPGLEASSERSGVLLTSARGPHAKAAALWARDLAAHEHGPVRALHVQKNIGGDSRLVGRRTLQGLMDRHLGSEAKEFESSVCVNDHRHLGILELYDSTASDLILMGSTKLGALGQRLRGTIFQKVLQANPSATVAVVRAAIPLSGRTQKWVGGWIQRRIPQLERDSRVALVERVQSNSHWDFDFVALMSLSTLIAASGLIVNSSAVIIGAMLVAPLMTPIMGIGMALVQGNPPLLRLAFRSVGLGFITAFLIGLLLGLTQSQLDRPTTEMLGRHWPGLLDLFVAFVAGLAGVYSSSRPNLVAALPGVAIAAALVPPIATAGVALAIGDVQLCMGASLLFLTNFVAIALASAIGLWAVGMREGQSGSGLTRFWGISISVLALTIAIALSLYPNLKASALRGPQELTERLRERLSSNYRLLDIEIQRSSTPWTVGLNLAGESQPSRALVGDLRSITSRVLEEKVRLRVRVQWEMESSAP